MKKLFLKGALVAFAVSMLIPTQSYSYYMKTWTWRHCKIKFKLPSNWKVVRSNAWDFIARGPNMVTIRIRPTRLTGTARRVARYAFNTYGNVVRNRSVVMQKYLPYRGGLYRYIIYGKGYHINTRRPVRFGIIGIYNSSNPYGKKLIWARFWWYKQYNYKFNRLTYKIAQSFQRMY